MMDAFWAVPEWAPADESHLLGSLSAVTKIAYGAGRVTYSTFDADSTDVLRLNFAPDAVRVGGRAVSCRKDLEQEGYTFDETRPMCSGFAIQVRATWTYKVRAIRCPLR